jgi:hypothetical protein
MNTDLIFAARLVGQTITDLSRMDANQDGETSSKEVFGTVSGLGLRLMNSIPQVQIGDLWSQLREGTDVRQEALDELTRSTDLPNDKVEAILDDGLNLLEDMVTDVVKYRGRIEALVADIKALNASDIAAGEEE